MRDDTCPKPGEIWRCPGTGACILVLSVRPDFFATGNASVDVLVANERVVAAVKGHSERWLKFHWRVVG